MNVIGGAMRSATPTAYQRRGARYGVVTTFIAGGMGAAARNLLTGRREADISAQGWSEAAPVLCWRLVVVGFEETGVDLRADSIRKQTPAQPVRARGANANRLTTVLGAVHREGRRTSPVDHQHCTIRVPCVIRADICDCFSHLSGNSYTLLRTQLRVRRAFRLLRLIREISTCHFCPDRTKTNDVHTNTVRCVIDGEAEAKPDVVSATGVPVAHSPGRPIVRREICHRTMTAKDVRASDR
jgi:hypothetical protein